MMQEQIRRVTPARAFMNDVARQGYLVDQGDDELDPIIVLGAHITLAHLWVDTVHISKLKTPPKLRGKGLANFALSELVHRADGLNVTLTVDCTTLDKKAMTTDQLRAYYRKWGFVETGEYAMKREPSRAALVKTIYKKLVK